MRIILCRLISVIFVSILSVGPTWAVPLLSFDLDIGTPGSQTSRDVQVGDNFTVAVLLSDYDSTTLIDTVSFDLNYNNSAAVISGSGGPAAGALVDLSPIATWDGFALSFTDINQGDLLSTLNLGTAPGFQSNFGTFIYSSITDPFVLSGTDPLTVATYNFTASAAGTSLLSMAAIPAALNYQGTAIDMILGEGLVNVVASVPEPTSLVLFGIGLTGLLLASRSRNPRHQHDTYP